MKKSLVLALGCAVVLAGCGSANTAADTSTTEVVEEAPKTEGAAETTSDSSAEASIEAAVEEFIEDELGLGEELTPDENGVISNGIITMTMPAESKDKYIAYSYDKGIGIYDKDSSDAGFGGFAFGVDVAEDYATFSDMATKIGELTESDGKLYHIVLTYPSDVQWDYTKGEEMPESYRLLYENAREIASTIQSANGGTYVDGAGTKGEDIYGELTKEIVAKIAGAKDAKELEAAELSPVYYNITQDEEPGDPMKDFGICYADFNLDGVDEMLIGDIKENKVYDIFASVEGEPKHVISGNEEDLYKVNGAVIAEYVIDESGAQIVRSFSLTPNSVELFPQYSLKLDESEGAKYKWSVSYDDGATWEELTEEDYEIMLSNIEYFSNDTVFEYKPLGEFK